MLLRINLESSFLNNWKFQNFPDVLKDKFTNLRVCLKERYQKKSCNKLVKFSPSDFIKSISLQRFFFTSSYSLFSISCLNICEDLNQQWLSRFCLLLRWFGSCAKQKSCILFKTYKNWCRRRYFMTYCNSIRRKICYLLVTWESMWRLLQICWHLSQQNVCSVKLTLQREKWELKSMAESY